MTASNCIDSKTKTQTAITFKPIGRKIIPTKDLVAGQHNLVPDYCYQSLSDADLENIASPMSTDQVNRVVIVPGYLPKPDEQAMTAYKIVNDLLTPLDTGRTVLSSG